MNNIANTSGQYMVSENTFTTHLTLDHIPSVSLVSLLFVKRIQRHYMLHVHESVLSAFHVNRNNRMVGRE